VCQNLVPLVNIKIAGKWMFIPLKMVLIGIDPYPNGKHSHHQNGSVPIETTGFPARYRLKTLCLRYDRQHSHACGMDALTDSPLLLALHQIGRSKSAVFSKSRELCFLFLQSFGGVRG
jgi:hypothetical protein